MTREEAIARIKGHMFIHKMNEPRAIHISEALDMAIKALEKEPCEDAISRQALIERIDNAEENFKIDNMDSISSDVEDPFVDGVLSGVFNIRQMVAQAPSVTPTHTETVTEFADRCRECGKTAITRAENDEILNEAWHLMQNATEEDGEYSDKNL